MSAPAPVTVKALFANVDLPAVAGFPMSEFTHGAGNVDAAADVVRFVNVARATRLVLWLVTARPTCTEAGRATVTESTWVHDVPSDERYPVKIFPCRTS